MDLGGFKVGLSGLFSKSESMALSRRVSCVRACAHTLAGRFSWQGQLCISWEALRAQTGAKSPMSDGRKNEKDNLLRPSSRSCSAVGVTGTASMPAASAAATRWAPFSSAPLSSSRSPLMAPQYVDLVAPPLSRGYFGCHVFLNQQHTADDVNHVSVTHAICTMAYPAKY